MTTLLRCGSLLAHVLAGAGAEGRVDLPRVGGVDHLDSIDIHAAPVAGVSEHRHRLATVVHQHLGASTLCQVKSGSDSRPVRKKPSVSLTCAK
jgi:hypothetical protein